MGSHVECVRYVCFSTIMAAAAGCGEGRPGVADPGAWEAAPVAEVAATIGMLEAPTEYLFGDIRSVAADQKGRIYVADRIGSTVRAYDAEGRFLRRIGREGEGPGEYEWPGDLTFGPDGRLHIRDLNRITVLESRTPGGIPDSVAETWRIPGLPNYLSSRRSRVDEAGRYYYPARRGSTYFYLVFEGGQHAGDTVRVPEYSTLRSTRRAFYMYPGSGDGLVFDGLAHAPFEAVAAWDITLDGTVIGGDGIGQKVLETDAMADTLRVVALNVRRARRPTPSRERADSARALQERLDSLPVPIAELQNATDAVRSGDLPDSLPAWRSLHVATNGSIWVERWPLEGEADKRFYDVFSDRGVYQGPVILPLPLLRDPPPYFTDVAVYGVVRDSVTDVHRVVKLVFDLNTP